MYTTTRVLTTLAIAAGGIAVIRPGGAAPIDHPGAQQRAATREQAVFVRPSDAELRKKLTRVQFEVTRRDATETPFRNEFWDHHAAGIYVDIISGEPLFSSLDKYDSGTGWPSFTRPLEPNNIRTKVDFKIGYPRTEARSRLADSHLGHIFNDGPRPTGLRYCMNSAALRFVPVDRLEVEGYGKYLSLFQPVPQPPARK